MNTKVDSARRRLKTLFTCKGYRQCLGKGALALVILALLTPAGREWALFALSGGKWVTPKGWPWAQPWREWDIPTDPRELAAYEYAHSLKLPDSLPKPVPFNFSRYLLSDRRATAAAYFDHLCKTEAGEYIFKTVDKVEGLYQMRAMPRRSDKVLRDRYGFEDPADWSLGEADHSVLSFIGAPSVGFRYFESRRRPEEIAISMYGKHWSVAPWSGTGSPPFWLYHHFLDLYDKGYTVGEVTPVAEVKSRYAYTWRGIRREGDREYGIAGGELIVLDRTTGEILGVRRSFAIAKQYKTHLDWEFAYYCPGLLDIYGQRKVRSKSSHPREFIRQILVPIDLVNPTKRQSQGEE